MEIIYIDSNITSFINTLGEVEQIKVLRIIEHLRRFGHSIIPPYSKKISGDLFELRTSGRIEIRIVYVFRHDRAVILHCFIKKTQKTPKKEINIALHKLSIYDNI